ncbi:hypothetical protein LINPERHAP1_LOCUS32578 [Linum perenne]
MGENGTTENEIPRKRKEQLTIFYNGCVCVSDVTEFKVRTYARAILMLAAGEQVEEMIIIKKQRNGYSSEQAADAAAAAADASDIVPQYMYSSFSMKKSLERFLQERKQRAHQHYNSPYHHRHHHHHS